MSRYASIVVLTGAGISAESGIQTFRGGGGLWEGHDIEEVATFDGYVRNPRKVLKFYNDRRRDLRRAGIEPNAAHLALAEFERNHPGEFLLVTQNVDDLHERAGSRELRHMHGELDKVRCQRCHQVYSSREDIEPSTQCPWCMAAGQVRPHIVWFGKCPFTWTRSTCAWRGAICSCRSALRATSIRRRASSNWPTSAASPRSSSTWSLRGRSAVQRRLLRPRYRHRARVLRPPATDLISAKAARSRRGGGQLTTSISVVT